MSYSKQEWVDNETLINAERMNHIEDGIADTQDSVPTKVSELDNDSGYITDEALGDYATKDAVEAAQSAADSALEKATEAQGAIPTKVSELENDSEYITDEALDGYAKEDAVEAVKETADSALEKADSAITAISVNGEDVPVENNKAEITVGGAPTVADETMYFVGDKPIYDEPTETVIF